MANSKQQSNLGASLDKAVVARRLLDKLLSEFDVPYKWLQISANSLTLEMVINYKRVVQTFLPSSGLNNVADLRRKLLLFGAPYKNVTPFREPERNRLSVPAVASQPTRRTLLETAGSGPPAAPFAFRLPHKNPPEPKEAALPPITSDTDAPTSDPDAPDAEPDLPPGDQQDNPEIVNEQASDADPEADAEDATPVRLASNPIPLDSPDSRVLYESALLEPTEVMVIELTRPLNAPVGHVLVVPLHDPRLLLDMPKAQFVALFRQKERPVAPVALSHAVTEMRAVEPAEEPSLSALVPADEPDEAETAEPDEVTASDEEAEPQEAEDQTTTAAEWVSFLRGQSLGQPVQEEPAEPQLQPEPALVEPPPPIARRRRGARKLKKKGARARPSPAPPPPAAILELSPESPALSIRSIRGVSTQVARQMLAIAHVQRLQNTPVRMRDLDGFLEDHDRKQVSARMPHVCQLGFARRYEATEDMPIRYQITRAGLELLATLHEWPWLRDGMKVPEWAKYFEASQTESARSTS